jgi:hypothetical protein
MKKNTIYTPRYPSQKLNPPGVHPSSTPKQKTSVVTSNNPTSPPSKSPTKTLLTTSTHPSVTFYNKIESLKIKKGKNGFFYKN